MMDTLKKLISDSLFKHSALIFVSSVAANILNLIFWLFMVRKLSPVDYGVLNSLISLMMFFSIPTSILMTVITRYVSAFMARQGQAEARSLLFYFAKVVGIFLAVVVALLVLQARAISGFLRIEEFSLIYIVSLGIVFSSFTGITLGALAGLQKFNEVALNNVASGIVKLAGGIYFVSAGLRVLGALLGYVFSFVTILCITVVQLPAWLKKLTSKMNSVTLDYREIYKYFFPVGLGMLSFFALTNMDIILVKHFFLPLKAGYYSVAQMVGKIVLFIPGAVGVVMFPKVVDSHARNGNTRLILKKCLLVVAFLCGGATFFTFLFPSFILKLLTGHVQPMAVSLVMYFSLCMSFFALVQILMLYHLSLHRMKYIYTLCCVAVLQFVGIFLFHSSLKQVLSVMLFASVILFYLGIRYSQKEITSEEP